MRLLALLKSSVLGSSAIDSALVANWKGFEDALQYFAALNAKADLIVTRNKKDFAASEIKVMTPMEYIKGKTE